MQEEDYLEDSDFDDIRRNDHINRIGAFNANSNSHIHIQYDDWNPTQKLQSRYKNYNYREKNQPILTDFHELRGKSRVKRGPPVIPTVVLGTTSIF